MIKKIAVINDLSGLGKCSLTAAIPVISVMGVQPCPMPTAILSNQTNYEHYYSYDYTKHIDFHIEEWKKMNLSFDGIYTGYLGSEAQIAKILHFIDTFKKEDTLLLVDPVMGDSGVPYDVYTPEFGRQMRSLALQADIITPNLTELCMLTCNSYEELITKSSSSDYLERIADMGMPLLQEGIKTVIVTGINYQNKLFNLVLENDAHKAISSEIYGGSYSGTGDLLASVVCAGILKGKTALESVRLATSFIGAALIETVADQIPRNDGINFEPYLGMLIE